MATGSERPSTIPDIIDKSHRELRDLGNDQPGISLPKDSMRELGLLDEDGVETEQEVLVVTYRDGRIVIDLQTE